MTTIHAYVRSSPCTVDLFGEQIKFAANDKGHLVAEVAPGPALDRLLELKEGYKIYGAVEAPKEDDDKPLPVSPYVLTVEGEGGAESTVDLRELNVEQLHAFCEANEIKFHKQAGAEKLRDTIVEFFKVE